MISAEAIYGTTITDEYVILDMNGVMQVKKPEVQYEGQLFYAKEELHTTLLSMKRTAPTLCESWKLKNDERGRAMIRHFLGLVVDDVLRTDPVYAEELTPTGELRYVKKDDRQSIIAMLHDDRVASVFGAVRKLLHNDVIPTQPVHMTLFTADQGGRGIAISSMEELDEISLPIDARSTTRIWRAVDYNFGVPA